MTIPPSGGYCPEQGCHLVFLKSLLRARGVVARVGIHRRGPSGRLQKVGFHFLKMRFGGPAMHRLPRLQPPVVVFAEINFFTQTYYALIEARAGYTRIASEVFTVELECLQN